MEKSSQKKSSSKKAIFALKISCPLKDLWSKFVDLMPSQSQENVTSLNLDSLDKELTFIDEARKVHHCFISAIDFNTASDYCCFWDRHPITDPSTAIGLPIKYRPDVISRAYMSEINKEKFMVKESIHEAQKIPDDFPITKESNHYYESDGIFCGLPCAFAFYNEHKKNVKYKDTETLLHRLSSTPIQPAPHWRTLKVYGGKKDIVQFREDLTRIECIPRGPHKPIFRSLGLAFEDRLKL